MMRGTMQNKQHDELIQQLTAAATSNPDAALLSAAVAEIKQQQRLIDNLAMAMRKLLAERDCARKARQLLEDNNLMGSPLRSEGGADVQ